MVTWEKLLKRKSKQQYILDWEVFITWIDIGIFVILFWVWVAFGIIRIIYWFK